MKVGIDLGTTFSAVAVYDEKNGRPRIIPNPEGERLTPSIICFAEDGEIIVGSEAKEYFESGEDGCVSVFKRRMGDRTAYCEAWGKSYTAQDLSAILLKYLKDSAERMTGEKIEEAVVTVPAYFYQRERAATMEAAEKAGLKVKQIINEPVAAALTYAVGHWRENARIMVYDLGGGTFDVTMIQMLKYGVMKSLETTGNHILGGKDWDEMLAGIICDKALDDTGVNIREEPEIFKKVTRAAENLKRKLTQFDSVSIKLNLPDYGEYIAEVMLDEFDSCTRPILERTGNLCHNLLSGLGMTWDDVTDILLVGGSTKMKQVPAYLKEISGHVPITHVDPDEAVALGAAIQVHLPMPEYVVTEVSLKISEVHNDFSGLESISSVSGNDDNSSIVGKECVLDNALSIRHSDIVAHAMGIIAVNDEGTEYINKTIVPANQQIPCKCAEAFRFYTADGSKNELEIYVLQGTAAPLESNIIGKYVVSGITHNKYENPTIIRIQYSYDVNGMIHVQARQGNAITDLPIREEPAEKDMSRFGKPIPKGELSVKKDGPLSVVLALDVSGSMRGAPIRNAKKAMCSFVDKLTEKTDDVRISVIAVSDSTMECQPLTNDMEACKAAIREIDAEITGVGNSWHPFYKINDILSAQKGAKYAIVLADGIWMNPKRAVEAAKECHRNGIDVVGMGFGEADEKFMRAITSGSIDSIMLGGSKELERGFGTIAQEISAGNSKTLKIGKDGKEIPIQTWMTPDELKNS